jgi:hypothetical protein
LIRTFTNEATIGWLVKPAGHFFRRVAFTSRAAGAENKGSKRRTNVRKITLRKILVYFLLVTTERPVLCTRLHNHHAPSSAAWTGAISRRFRKHVKRFAESGITGAPLQKGSYFKADSNFAALRALNQRAK